MSVASWPLVASCVCVCNARVLCDACVRVFLIEVYTMFVIVCLLYLPCAYTYHDSRTEKFFGPEAYVSNLNNHECMYTMFGIFNRGSLCFLYKTVEVYYFLKRKQWNSILFSTIEAVEVEATF